MWLKISQVENIQAVLGRFKELMACYGCFSTRVVNVTKMPIKDETFRRHFSEFAFTEPLIHILNKIQLDPAKHSLDYLTLESRGCVHI